MNNHATLRQAKPAGADPALTKADAALPALIVTGPRAIAVRAGTTFAGHHFAEQAAIPLPDELLHPGCDYAVLLRDGAPAAVLLAAAPTEENFLGGFHFAPGGNAAGRAGGDALAAINPWSLWDRNFRPACPDPRGMTFVDAGAVPGARLPFRFWCDIYLTGAEHLAGTSRYGVTIADGNDPPQQPAGGVFSNLDYETAVAVVAHHGKGLLSFAEFAAAAYGVTEKSAAGRDPKLTGLDAPRTSKFGLMQATGNLWAWGHDGDPDTPRASVLGGSWRGVACAGSRFADLVSWPGGSGGFLGVRGRSDHLQPV